ncbi:hypothetical protein BKA62DRAFT_694870 [Auriculariales sp. MPI-PUGE-AT-0066]|nr:hypothetical protein BKA62DRAFT_694870 [Auriculariales sp. MPI-PUGE-AT-0066]
MAFRSTCRRMQQLTVQQLEEAEAYAHAVAHNQSLPQVISIHRPSRQRIRTLHHLLARVSYKPTPAFGSGTNWSYFIDARNTGAYAVMPSGSPRRVSLALVSAGLATLPSAFTRRVWAGGKLTYSLAPRQTAAEACAQEVRISQTVSALQIKSLHSERPSVRMTRRIVYGFNNLPGLQPRLVEDRTHVFTTPQHPREVRQPDMPLVPSATWDYTPDATTLFWYSMLTQNPHRIHYDTDYAKSEQFEDRVVHGPLTASLLLQFLNAQKPAKLQVHSFEYRATNPFYVDRKMRLCIMFREPRPDEPRTVQDPIESELQGRNRFGGRPHARSQRDIRHATREAKWHDAFHHVRHAYPDVNFHEEFTEHFAEQIYEEEANEEDLPLPLDVSATAPARYNVARVAELWAVDTNGIVGMQATALLVEAPMQKLDGFGLQRKPRSTNVRALREHAEMNHSDNALPHDVW